MEKGKEIKLSVCNCTIMAKVDMKKKEKLDCRDVKRGESVLGFISVSSGNVRWNQIVVSDGCLARSKKAFFGVGN